MRKQEESAAGGSRGTTGRFYLQGNNWFCRTGLRSDIIIEVGDVLFHLHKFPLLSKCGKIAKLVEVSQNAKEDTYNLSGCPGGSDAFFLVVEFCYGIPVELTPKNILIVYSAAAYLEMTEEYEEGNLLVRAESFIHKVILRSWKDCIMSLQSAEKSMSEAYALPVVSKCVSALSMMVCTDLSLFGWPMMLYGSLQSPGGSILWNGINTGARIRSSVSDWWFEDITSLSVPMFKKLIERMNHRGARQENTVNALIYCAKKYLPGLDRWHGSKGRLRSFTATPTVADQKAILESIEVLLPEKKGKSYCRFLLGLLRFAIILNVCQQCKDSVERKIGMQLELATLDALLIPSFSDSDEFYDTDCVERIIQHFLSSQESCIASFSPSSSDPASSPRSSPLIKVSKLIDSYLAEVAPDVNLRPEKMHSLLKAIPESSRSLDDGLYRVVDIYFKAHPSLTENEKEQLCDTINCRKLSIDACEHASRNERLPLRVVLKALFFEQLQLRTAISSCLQGLETSTELDITTNDTVDQILQRDGWVSLVQQNRNLRVDMEQLRSRVRELETEFTSIKQEMVNTERSHSLISSTHSKYPNIGCVGLISRVNDPTGNFEATGRSPRKSVDVARSITLRGV